MSHTILAAGKRGRLPGSPGTPNALAVGIPAYPTPPVVNRWVSSNGTGDGLTAGNPMSLSAARTTASAGGLVFGLYGPNSGVGTGIYSITSTLQFSNGGTVGNPVVYRAVDVTDKPIIRWTNASQAVSGNFNVQLMTGVSYFSMYAIRCEGDGGSSTPNNWPASGFRVGSNSVIANNHHIGFYGCEASNFGSAGISTGPVDYFEAMGNMIHHCGYYTYQDPTRDSTHPHAWSSGISLWRRYKSDTNAGFHNLVIGNVCAGIYDGMDTLNSGVETHSDGNGFIVDLTFNAITDPPWTLLLNNIAYGCGGDGFISTGGPNVWMVNNTAYKNGLDTQEPYAPAFTAVMSADSVHATDNRHINNASEQWPTFTYNTAYANTGARHGHYVDATEQTTMVIGHNVTKPARSFPSAYNDGTRIITTSDMQWLVSPPVSIADTGTTNYSSVPAPWSINLTNFTPNASSPLKGAGEDPRNRTESDTTMDATFTTYWTKDIFGNPRSTSSPSVGAIEPLSDPVLGGGVLELSGSGATGATFTRPSEMPDGAQVFVWLALTAAGAVTSSPAGQTWALTNGNTNTEVSGRLYTHLAAAGETTFAFTWTVATSYRAQLVWYTGHNGFSSVTGAPVASATTSHTTPSITADPGDRLLVFYACDDPAAVVWTPPTGMTQVVNNPGPRIAALIAQESISTSGTYSRTATTSTAQYSVEYIIALHKA